MESMFNKQNVVLNWCPEYAQRLMKKRILCDYVAAGCATVGMHEELSTHLTTILLSLFHMEELVCNLRREM